jgi:hypothetical protein
MDAAPPAPVAAWRQQPRAADPDRRQAYNDLPLPPRYPRSRSDDGRDYAYGYGPYNAGADDPAAYGPPPSDSYQSWLPRPHRRAWTSAYNGN